MSKYTNNKDISLYHAAWLVSDEYDYQPEKRYISATSLLKPTKSLILGSMVPPDLEPQLDLEEFIARAMGNAIHAGIENVWLSKTLRDKALSILGYSVEEIESVVVNPTGKVKDHQVPIYIEQRAKKKHRGWTIGGKFDAIIDGELFDTKSTSAWTWVFDDRAANHRIQGSIYRWLNPDKVKSEYMYVSYVFTDWVKFMSNTAKDYPDARMKTQEHQLLSISDTEDFINTKLKQLRLPVHKLPRCTDEELWLKPATYKYYSDPAKMTRATKNFEDYAEALAHYKEKGKGLLVTVPAIANACRFCPAYPICEQAKEYNTQPEEK